MDSVYNSAARENIPSDSVNQNGGKSMARSKTDQNAETLRDVTGDPEYKNKHLASVQRL